MFKKYGIIGLILIAFVELNFILKIQPFADNYFPIVWFGYILVVDALVYRLKNKSLISNKPKLFFSLIVLSAVFWWTFELFNKGISLFHGAPYWAYHNASLDIFSTIPFSTVLPAVFETAELLSTIHLFDKVKLKKEHKINKSLLIAMTWIGIAFLVVPFIIESPYLGQAMWFGFFFLLDPFNYMHNKPSIIGCLKAKKFVIPISLFIGGMVCGFFWEFWNYWAIPKWIYTMNPPFLGIRLFEMPLSGYIMYGPFAWSLYAAYNFIRTILHGKLEKVI